MAIVDELQTGRNHHPALLGMAEHTDLMTAAPQFARDAEHRRDVATAIPCDDQHSRHISSSPKARAG